MEICLLSFCDSFRGVSTAAVFLNFEWSQTSRFIPFSVYMLRLTRLTSSTVNPPISLLKRQKVGITPKMLNYSFNGL